MKKLMKSVLIIEIIALLGVTLLFVLVKTGWLQIDMTPEKVSATVLVFAATGLFGYYVWLKRRKNSNKT